MIGYVRIREAVRTVTAGVIRTKVSEGHWGDDEFKVTHDLSTRNPDARLYFSRKGQPEVQVDLASLLRAVFTAQDEADPDQPHWQPMVPVSTVRDSGVERPLEDDEEMWSNDLYTAVVVRRESPGGFAMIHISYHRHDKAPVRDWRHGQQIKNDIAGPDAEGIELYPADDRMVDMANQYHLWCIDGRWPVGFDEGRQVLSAAATEDLMLGHAKQRDPS